jgi:hypothetical protein
VYNGGSISSTPLFRSSLALVTIRILDGPERGKAYPKIATPVSIGREEGNFIQLNDERVSRYHLKIHENNGVVLLTDLQSTNGTRVNGEVVQVWQLRPGDVITLGRSVLVFGSTEEIAKRLSAITLKREPGSAAMGAEGENFQFLEKSFQRNSQNDLSSRLFEIEIFRGLTPEELAPLHQLAPPELPKGLPPKETAQMAEYLQYLLLRLRYLVSTVRNEPGTAKNGEEGKEDRVSLSAAQWQNVIDLYARVSEQLTTITEP